MRVDTYGNSNGGGGRGVGRDGVVGQRQAAEGNTEGNTEENTRLGGAERGKSQEQGYWLSSVMSKTSARKGGG